MGKIKAEGIGEVQEFVDICDLACGLSRQIGGAVLPSERPGHFMLEQWNPLGLVGVISAFNFPNAVFGWNTAIALVCGDQVVWKGSESASLTTIATTKLVTRVLERNGFGSLLTTCQGNGKEIGETMINDKRLPLISFTGSTKTGRHVSQTVASRFGKTILELGGNNAAVVMDDADLDMTLKSSCFGAVGTAGQRCTSLRRMYIHEKVYD